MANWATYAGRPAEGGRDQAEVPKPWGRISKRRSAPCWSCRACATVSLTVYFRGLVPAKGHVQIAGHPRAARAGTASLRVASLRRQACLAVEHLQGGGVAEAYRS